MHNTYYSMAPHNCMSLGPSKDSVSIVVVVALPFCCCVSFNHDLLHSCLIFSADFAGFFLFFFNPKSCICTRLNQPDQQQQQHQKRRSMKQVLLSVRFYHVFFLLIRFLLSVVLVSLSVQFVHHSQFNVIFE